MQKLSFQELMAFEKKHHLWEDKLFDYPLWIHCREPMLSTGILADRKINRPKVMSMLKSFFKTLSFLINQKKYDKVYFLMERAELLEIYNQDKSKKKILFLNPEQEKVYEGDDYISSNFFNLIRFISRKVTFLIFKKKYNKTIENLEKIGCSPEINKYIKFAMGDAMFLRFLSFILLKKSDKMYTGSVIPMGEKFMNSLNSFEVQHGVIHPEHIGYIGVPKVKNTLILYSSRYEFVLRNHGYEGKLLINEYKNTFFEKKSQRYFPIVIYTQPTETMQVAVDKFINKYKSKDIFIQRHPKDYFNYKINNNCFVTATTPFEVGYPILYLSSVIENFTQYDKKCYIYDLKYSDINVEEFLNIYIEGSKSEMIVLESLDAIYEEIQKHMLCQK
ncbi:MAG TPA: hypothetical protein EYG74_01630 [Sulfurimonas autotrophica]|nr:hypothetical protein [Sulfurimonas autotrophica]